jgi:prepilin-type N-terminal cleavage/methylation domain-containing protein
MEKKYNPGSEPSRFFARREKGFSLVEILVVITIMALLVTLVATSASNILDKSRVTACQKNLKDIAQNMILMKNDRRQRGKKGWPKYKGIRFLLELTTGSANNPRLAYISGQKSKIFICPGTDDINTAEENDTPGSAYFDLEDIDTYTISYAGRNQVDFPIDRDRLGDDAVLAADDNEGRANHKFTTNYVTVGPAVDAIDIRDYIDDFPELGELGYFPVGPDSPSEMLQKLLVDY